MRASHMNSLLRGLIVRREKRRSRKALERQPYSRVHWSPETGIALPAVRWPLFRVTFRAEHLAKLSSHPLGKSARGFCVWVPGMSSSANDPFETFMPPPPPGRVAQEAVISLILLAL